jgi:hypothetical protein
MPKDLILLRYTDANNRRLAALCRPANGVEVLRAVIGEETESDEEWFSQPHQSAVVIDTDGAVTITSQEDMASLCLWLAVASQWLQAHGG